MGLPGLLVIPNLRQSHTVRQGFRVAVHLPVPLVRQSGTRRVDKMTGSGSLDMIPTSDFVSNAPPHTHTRFFPPESLGQGKPLVYPAHTGFTHPVGNAS